MFNNRRDNFVLVVASVGIAVVVTIAASNSDHTRPQEDPHPMRTAVQPAVSPSLGITEDDPSWNCFTDGNGVCGPSRTYGPIPKEGVRRLHNDLDPERDWSKCVWSKGDITYVYCSDGYTIQY